MRTPPRRLGRRWAWAVVDGLAWVVGIVAADWLRFDFDRHQIVVSAAVWLSALAVGLQLLIGAAVGPYAVRHERGSFEETSDVGRTAAIVGALVACLVIATRWHGVPRSVPFTATALAMLIMFTSRFVIRSWRTRLQATPTADARRAIVFGAGDAGRRLTRSLMRDTESNLHPVALLDDDPRKARLRFEGIRVRGSRRDMAAVAAASDADTLIIALPQAAAGTIRVLTELAEDAGLGVLTLPPLSEIIGCRPTASDLRDVNVEDLLGRRPVALDTTVIAEQIAGRRVLVTGAGGSIGSELCRQISRFGPAKLFLLDRDESGLLATQMSLSGEGLLQGDDVILANIRDLAALRAAFAAAQPDLVFHAAALKHLPLLETYPLEAWKTNVVGTLNVLTAATEVGVGTFVNISTDKAADPTCVLGYSKRLAERLTADFAANQAGRYVSVRFGNVLGSRGSVLHTFTAQIERGGPVTVTHPDVRRFFMLIPEACQLVLEAASIGVDGEVMVLDMGEQVKILDVAQTLVRMSGKKGIDITFTGLRPGEKLAEDLFFGDEERLPSGNPLIDRVSVPRLPGHEIEAMVPQSHDEAATWMHAGALDGLHDVRFNGAAATEDAR